MRCRESIVTFSFWCTHSGWFVNRFNFWFTSPSRGAGNKSLQDKSLLCAQPSFPVKTAYAKAHLQFVSLCCPSTLLESVVIRSVIGYYVAPGLHNIALSWLSQWVLLHDTKGFRRVSTVPMWCADWFLDICLVPASTLKSARIVSWGKGMPSSS